MSLTGFPDGGTALVVGASGGIGAALAEALGRKAVFARVISAARAGPVVLDLTREETVAALAASLEDAPALRLVINAAGFLHEGGLQPEKSLKMLEADYLARAFQVNAIGPALLMKHLLPCLAPRGRAVFACLSARVGSIGDNRLGGWHGYRASKAALNQFLRTASVEMARRRPEAVLAALHPGTVATRLSEPFAKRGLKVRPPAEAARDVLAVIDRLTPADSGGFFDQHGAPIPW